MGRDFPYADYGPEFGTMRPPTPARRAMLRHVAAAFDLPDAHPMFCEWGPPERVLPDPERLYFTFGADHEAWARLVLQPFLRVALDEVSGEMVAATILGVSFAEAEGTPDA